MGTDRRAGRRWLGGLTRSLTQAVPPVDLAAAGMPGCFAHVANPVATLLLAPASSTQVAESIPNNPVLIGVALVGQAVAFEPTRSPLGLVATNAMVLTLGM